MKGLTLYKNTNKISTKSIDTNAHGAYTQFCLLVLTTMNPVHQSVQWYQDLFASQIYRQRSEMLYLVMFYLNTLGGLV